MAQQSLSVSSFHGGISPDEKIGLPFSARLTKHLDVHADGNSVKLFPKLTKVSDADVDSLVLWMADGSPYSTDRYAYAQNGDIYKETSGGTWSLLRAVSNASGNGFAILDDYLYYSLDAELGRYGKLSGTPAFDDSFLTDGTTNVDQTGGGTGATDYSTTTGIDETATHRQTFTPARDTLKAVIIDVDVVGTGDWTVTVHDSRDNSIGTSTIVNGSMDTGDITFTLSTPGRVVIGNDHHFHVTTTVADGGVDTGTNTDLEDAEFTTLFGILVSDLNWHPAEPFLNGVVIGNESYLAFWDQATYNPNRVVLAPGFNVRSLAVLNEYIVADCWKGTTVQDAEIGRRYYWDGIQDTFNFFENLPYGAPNLVHNRANKIFSIGGQRGQIYLGSNPPLKIQETPKLASGKYVEVYPGAVTEWLGKTYIGVAGLTDDNTDVLIGVYEFGSKADAQSEVLDRDVLTFVQSMSTGKNTGTTRKVGMVKAFGKSMYVSWFDDDDAGDYGVDKVTIGDNAQTSGDWESLIFDNGRPMKPKTAIKMVVGFKALAANEMVTPKYKINRASSFTDGDTVSTVDKTQAVLDFGPTEASFREIEIGFTLGASTTSPTVTSVLFIFDDRADEDDFQVE